MMAMIVMQPSPRTRMLMVCRRNGGKGGVSPFWPNKQSRSNVPIPHPISQTLPISRISTTTTVLHVAAQKSHLPVVKHLCDQDGCNVNAVDKHGSTSLQIATRHNQSNTAAFLEHEPAPGCGQARAFSAWAHTLLKMS